MRMNNAYESLVQNARHTLANLLQKAYVLDKIQSPENKIVYVEGKFSK